MVKQLNNTQKIKLMKQLQNKVAIITGGATHLAIRTAKLFLDKGANVVLVDNNKEALEKVISQIGNERLKFCVADTTLSRSVQNYVNRTVEIFGKIDIFFNHADTEDFFAPISAYPEAVFDHVIATHLKGAWLGNKYVVPHMNHGGSIVMTSSVAGLFGYANLSALVASEHAVVGIMRATALETEEKQIRVNTVHPSIDSTQAHRGNSVDYLVFQM